VADFGTRNLARGGMCQWRCSLCELIGVFAVRNVMKELTVLVTLVVSSAEAEAEPMHFEKIRNGGNCAGCSYVQATGEITPETPKEFEAFAGSQKYGASPVRLNSPGGSLLGGILLGETFRVHGISTEVGSSTPLQDASEPGLANRAPGVCASACAYSFLGGVERSLDNDAKLGFHRFYQENALAEPTAKIFTGQDVGDAQKTTAGLALYVLKMGVDPSLVALAASAGPNEMRWILKDDAQKLRVTYEPSSYKPWRVEAYKGGAIAITESNDGIKSVVVSCSRQLGPNVALINSKPTWDVASWFEQCRNLNLPGGGQPVFGTRVSPDGIKVLRRKDGGAIMRFQLPTQNPPLTSSEMLSFQEGYPRACSTNEYLASRENFMPAVRLALRNCFQD
jgi:hypothetical protein